MTEYTTNYSSKPVKQRIVLWSALIMFSSLIANVVLLTIAFSEYEVWEHWLMLSIAFSTVFVFATIAFIVSVIIRLVERAKRKAQLLPKTGEAFD